MNGGSTSAKSSSTAKTPQPSETSPNSGTAQAVRCRSGRGKSVAKPNTTPLPRAKQRGRSSERHQDREGAVIPARGVSRTEQMRSLIAALPPEKQPLTMPTGDLFFRTANSVCIVLPPPHPALNAHNKGHWRKKTKLVKSLRWWSARTAANAMKELKLQTFAKASIGYLFYFPDDIQRDSANAIQSQKPAVDGLVDAKLLSNDNWQTLHLAGAICGIDRKNPRTVLVITPIDSVPSVP